MGEKRAWKWWFAGANLWGGFHSVTPDPATSIVWMGWVSLVIGTALTLLLVATRGRQ